MPIAPAGRELARQIVRNPAITDRELSAICAENAHQIFEFRYYMPNLRAAKFTIADRAEDARTASMTCCCPRQH